MKPNLRKITLEDKSRRNPPPPPQKKQKRLMKKPLTSNNLHLFLSRTRAKKQGEKNQGITERKITRKDEKSERKGRVQKKTREKQRETLNNEQIRF